MTADLTVAYVPLDDLEGDGRNPKRHADATIRESIGRFGYLDPIVRDDRTGRIVSGHGRAAALRQMRDDGQDPPEGIRVGDDGTWEVPVNVGWSSRSDDEAAAALVALNRTVELGGWDDVALEEILASLDDWTGVGYDEHSLAELQAQLAEEQAPDLSDDEIPPTPDSPTAELGDLWTVGPHRIVCGDASDPDAYDRLLDGQRAAIVWTDPPYGVSYQSSGRPDKHAPIANDSLGSDQLTQFLRDTLALALAHSGAGAPWYVAAPPGPQFLSFAQVLTEFGVWRQTIAWVKDRHVLGRSDYHGAHESIFYGTAGESDATIDPDPSELDRYDPAYVSILYGWDPSSSHRFYGGRKQNTVWHFPKPTASDDHPTMKPLALIGRALMNSSTRDAAVLDPFAGSGSTLVAAARTGRIGYGIELDPGYVDVIVRRLEEQTGETGVRVDP